MAEQQDARQMLERAEHAATAGDLASADELLRTAAHIQEQQLGPLHPDLANTLNNLAIVAERTGRASEAETLYRRAAAIAAAAFPSDHPMAVASRQNLEDFCRARGLSIDAPPVITPEKGAPPPSAAPQPDPGLSSTMAAQPLPRDPAPERASYSLAWVATGAVVLAAAVLLVLRPWSSSPDPPAPAPAAAPVAAQPAEPAPPPVAAPRAAPVPIESAQPPKAAPRSATGDITVVNAELCRNFSTSGRSWRCDPLGDSPAPGRIVFYTRIKSQHDASVIHRWYNRGTLRQSVTLRVQASAAEGYRTYSRQTVDKGDWRAEVKSADGKLLHEQRFAVR
jgi:hypothetical protein